MSLALIQESAKEVRRLAIAGSPLAVGDFRLKKLVAPLEQAGVKVPVFAQVAKAINDVVNGSEANSAVQLLNLSTLLNAILYTQGQSGADGDCRELEMFASNCSSTRTPARVLKPLVQALTTTGGGRFEIVKSAAERGAFNDLRLIDPAIQALGDVYPELADLVAKKILPSYGPGIVPRLKSGLDLNGKKPDARRLLVMHQLDPEGTLALCKTALEDGSPEVKVAALACLGQHEDCLPLVLEQANAKNKQLRAAALEALAEHDRPEVTKLFTELVKGKALDILAGPFRKLHNKQVLESLLEEGRRVFDLILKGDSDQIARYWEILDCLQYCKDAQNEAFLLGCLANSDKLAKVKAAKNFVFAGPELLVRLVTLLSDLGTPQSLEAVLSKRATLPAEAFPQVLHCALRSWTPEKVFVEFGPLLAEKKGVGKSKKEELERIIYALSCQRGMSVFGRYVPDERQSEAKLNVDWDGRWLDAAIKADEQGVVCCFARPGHKGVINYLLNSVGTKNRFSPSLAIEALVKCGYAKVTDVFLELVAKKTKNLKQFDYDLQLIFDSARHLPVANLPKLDAFAATLDEKFVDQFLEAIAPLRTAPQSN